MTGKLNLAKFEHFLAPVKNKEGQPEECVVIPIKRNSIFKSDKGNLFVDIVALYVVPEKRKGEDSHMIIQSFSKEDREKIKAAGLSAPILGNLKEWGEAVEQPNTSADFSGSDISDLPF